MKRIISLILAMLMTVNISAQVLASTEPAEETAPVSVSIASGSCGSSVNYSLSGDGILTITGSGRMDDYRAGRAPWGSDRYSERIFQVVIGRGVTAIGAYAFDECENLHSVSIPDSVTSVGRGAFADCEALTGIELPAGVTSIGAYAFSGCERLLSIVIPKGVKAIENGTFDGCESLTGITIPSGVSRIGVAAFEDCESLWTVDISAGVKEIGADAFADCSRLTAVTIRNPDCTMPYAGGALGLAHLTTIRGYTGSTAESYADRHGYAFESIGASPMPNATPTPGANNILSGSCGSGVSYTLTNDGTLTILGKGAMTDYRIDSAPWCNWQYDNKVTAVVVKSGVTAIGDYAFYDLENLKSVSLPQTVTALGEGAFYDCEKLTAADLPAGLLTMGEYVFAGCDLLRSVSIPGGVKEIPGWAFDGCEALSSVTVSEGVAAIDTSAFEDCQSLQKIDLPASVQRLGAYVFDDCRRLASVTVRSRNCVFPTLGLGTVSFTIHGYSGSTAETFARQRGYQFRSLGTAPAPGYKDGWVTKDGQKYYYQDGKPVKGLKTIGTVKYYFSAKDGRMMKGLVNVGGGKKCYFSAKDGRMMKGLVTTDNMGTRRYFSAKDGHMMKNGWFSIGGGRKALINANGVVTKVKKA